MYRLKLYNTISESEGLVYNKYFAIFFNKFKISYLKSNF